MDNIIHIPRRGIVPPEDNDKDKEELDRFEEAYQRGSKSAKRQKAFLESLPEDLKPDPDDPRFSEEALRKSGTIEFVEILKEQEERKKQRKDDDRGR